MTETETDDTSSTDPAVLQFENKAALRDYIDDLARETIAKKIRQEIAEKTGQDPPSRTNASEEPDIDLSPTERREAINAAIAVDGTGFGREDREDLREWNDAALATVADAADGLLDRKALLSDADQRMNAAAGEDRLSEERREQLRSNREAMAEHTTDGEEPGTEASDGSEDGLEVPWWLDDSPTDEELRANEQREAREERTREQAEAFYSLDPVQQTELLNGRETTDPDVERVRANVGLVDEESGEPSDPADDLPDPAMIADPVERAHVRQKTEEAREARTNASESETSLKTPDEVRANVRGEEFAPDDESLRTPDETREQVRDDRDDD